MFMYVCCPLCLILLEKEHVGEFVSAISWNYTNNMLNARNMRDMKIFASKLN